MEFSLKNKGKALGGALLLSLAVLGSAFTSGKQDIKPVDKTETQTQHFFRNDGTMASPIWKYIGTVEPGPLDCTINEANYCYGESDLGADGSGNPLGTVSASKTGDYNP